MPRVDFLLKIKHNERKFDTSFDTLLALCYVAIVQNGQTKLSITKGKKMNGKTIKVNGETWGRYLKAKAEKSALEKKIKAFEASFGVPDAEALAKELSLTRESGADIPVVNGNGHYVGKVALYWFGGAVIDPAWRKRIS